MGYTPEFFYTSEYARLFALIEARNEYYKATGETSGGSDSDANALKQLDKFLG